MLGGEAAGPADLPLRGPAPADGDDPEGIAFAESEQYLLVAERSRVGAVIVWRGCREVSKPAIRVDNPRVAFGMVLALSVRPMSLNHGIHSTAVVDTTAQVDPTARIGPYVVVGCEARIGAKAQIYPHCYIGDDCSVGAGTVLYPGVVLYRDVTVGERCILHSGAVLGADGFGFAWDGERQVKIPQVGGVRLGSDVEIGACTAIDCATAGETTIGDDTKLDNLVQVGHNTHVGSHTVIAGLTGISGSCKLGNRLTLGGQVAVSDHMSVCDDVVLGGRTAIIQDVTEPGAYFGLPARPAFEALRSMALVTKLPELLSRVRALEKRVRELEGGPE
jgi:UDP-3-O-[3-hydroxymyristoyl] glucosamine N-acyltransferase